ncbi:MAG: hypothetical protein AAGC55_06110 [Myxococcota bacterium]
MSGWRARCAAVVLCLWTGGCGVVLETSREYEIRWQDDGDPRIDMVGAHDCALDVGPGLDTYVAAAPLSGEQDSPEMHIVGIWRSPGGQPVTVEVERRGAMVLVLTAFYATEWRVVPGPNTQITELVVTGYGEQRVAADSLGDEVAIVERNDDSSLGNAYNWPSESESDESCEYFLDRETCRSNVDWRYVLERRSVDLDKLISASTELYGRAPTSFTGCQLMSDLTLTESRPRVQL